MGTVCLHCAEKDIMIVLHLHSHMFGSLFCQMLLLKQMLECLGATFLIFKSFNFQGSCQC